MSIVEKVLPLIPEIEKILEIQLRLTDPESYTYEGERWVDVRLLYDEPPRQMKLWTLTIVLRAETDLPPFINRPESNYVYIEGHLPVLERKYFTPQKGQLWNLTEIRLDTGSVSFCSGETWLTIWENGSWYLRAV
jgi:hypothetical protein